MNINQDEKFIYKYITPQESLTGIFIVYKDTKIFCEYKAISRNILNLQERRVNYINSIPRISTEIFYKALEVMHYPDNLLQNVTGKDIIHLYTVLEYLGFYN